MVLSSQELDLKHYLQNRLAKLLREDEVKWYQRAKMKELLQGDSNTKFFHLVVSGRHRKSRIFQLRHEDQVIEGDAELKKHITYYYKGLFGPPDNSDISLDSSLIQDIPQVSDDENIFLTSMFLDNGIRDAIFQMEHNKAPEPDGFLAEFYQVFWNVIKGDLLPLFAQLHEGSLPLFSLNFGAIILLPN